MCEARDASFHNPLDLSLTDCMHACLFVWLCISLLALSLLVGETNPDPCHLLPLTRA